MKLTEAQRLQRKFEEGRRAWSLDQIRSFCKLLRRDIGDAWSWMTPRVQSALVAQNAFAIASSQISAPVETDAMRQLLVDMEREMGLRPEFEDES